MAPPVRHSQSWRGAPAVAPARNRPEVLPRRSRSAFSGSGRRRRPPRLGGERAGGQLGDGTSGRSRRPAGAPIASASARAPPPRRVAGRRCCELVHLHPSGHQIARLARVGEERHRRCGVDEDRCWSRRAASDGELGEVGQAVVGSAARRRARWRVGKVSASSLDPVASAIRPAATQTPLPQRPPPRNRRSARRRGSSASSATTSGATAAGRPPASAAAVDPGSVQQTSAGRISVATWDGRASEAATASAASAADSSVVVERCGPSRGDTLRPRSRCRTRAARRTACGTWRGHPRC
jgi:hypothetical protein